MTSQGTALDGAPGEPSGGLPVRSRRESPAGRPPDRPDPARLHPLVTHPVMRRLASAPPLVFTAECDLLRRRLAAVARGEALLIDGGSHPRTLGGVREDVVRGTLRTLLQMSVVLAYAVSSPVVKVGRTAGSLTDVRPGAAGEPDRARTPDPARLLREYEISAATLNLIRASTRGGFADLAQVHAWNRRFVADAPAGRRHARLTDEMDRALSFLRACGVDVGDLSEIFVSHEGALPDYERALTRADDATGLPYATSGHLLWIDAATCRPDTPQVDHLSRVRNPVAVRFGADTPTDTVMGHLDRLDPEREPGRLTFVVRAGADRVRDLLPPLVEKVTAEGARICWICDPLPAGTSSAPGGQRPRSFDAIVDEVRGFVEVHRALGTHPGGIRVEFGAEGAGEGADGGVRAPYVGHPQALELAFLLAEMYGEQRR